ncbi:MAG: hypothetical protein QNJ22_10020 [Desulfosarcinaceae bacterium]|nr:hypothetical protein [Desulfosarcinaceae bacterium]
MAKIAKRRLSWKASPSRQTIGYKLYWSRQGQLSYTSACEHLGPVTEVVVPDGLSAFTPDTGPFEFGVVAVDDSGNESDMVSIAAPFHFVAPEAPSGIQIDSVVTEATEPPKNEKILALKRRDKTAEKHTEKPLQQQPAKSDSDGDDDSLEFFETDRADAGVMFTKEDLEIFEADLKL